VSKQAVLKTLPLVFLVPAALFGASSQARPSRTKVNPLALEYKLLAYLAKENPSFRAEAAKRALYLKNNAGKGYTVSAVTPGARAASRQHTMRKAAYLALTGTHLNAVAGEVRNFAKKYKIKIRPIYGSKRSTDRAALIDAYKRGIEREIALCKTKISQARASLAGVGRIDPRHAARLEAYVRLLQDQIKRVQALGKRLEIYRPRIKIFDDFAAQIRRNNKSDNLLRAETVLADKVRLRAASFPGVSEIEAVGTQQVRMTLSAAKQKELESALAGVLDLKSRKKPRFFRKWPEALPLFWPLSKPVDPLGDFHVTEYISGGEVLATLFDTTGLWYRIVVLEYKGALHVLVPSDFKRTHYELRSKKSRKPKVR